MPHSSLQELCERGQSELMHTQYLDAARTLGDAENQAWVMRDFDTLSRLYLPLQEARRQIRQRCGEGVVKLHLLAGSDGANDFGSAEDFIQGQVLAAGWGSIQPALDLRREASNRQLYLEIFLAAVYPVVGADPMVAIVPSAGDPLPLPIVRSIQELNELLPANSLLLRPSEIPADADKGTTESFSGVMAIWESLHTPLLLAADAESDPMRQMQLYRHILAVDPACELAHQHLAGIARKLARAI